MIKNKSGVKGLSPFYTWVWKIRKILLILFVASFFLFYKINKPFIGHHDYNGAVAGVVARNYLANIGHLLKIRQWQSIDNIYYKTIIFYPHYPPLSFLLFTLSGMVFGVNEVSLRLVTVVFSLIMVFFIYKIGERLYNKNTGILASFLAIVTPMFIYFGKTPDHEPILAPLCTASFYFYLTLNDRKNRRNTPFFIFLALALLESWASYFFLLFLLVHAILYKWVSRKVAIIMIGIAASVIILQLLLIFFFQGPTSILGVLQYGLYRMNGNPSISITNFTLRQFTVTEIRYVIIYFTRILTGLSLLWLASCLFYWRKGSRDLRKFLIILFLYPLTFTLIFRNLMYIHDFKLYLFLPFIAISSASVLIKFLKGGIVFLPKSLMRQNWRYIQSIILTTVVIVVYMERIPYLKTLLLSSFDSPGYELGSLIRSRTGVSESVLLNSKEFGDFYKVFIDYYANRKIITQDITFRDYEDNRYKYEGYHFIILVYGRPVDKNIESYLLKNYSYEKTGPYTFVDISNNSPPDNKNI